MIVIALSYSEAFTATQCNREAFDSLRHSTLLNKMAQQDIPDNVYNWLVSYFIGHSQCTKYDNRAFCFSRNLDRQE